MVNRRHLIYIVLVSFVLTALVSNAFAQTEYHLNYEYAKVWINKDGTIDLLYNMSVTCDSGTIHWVKVGQPNSNFIIVSANDSNNDILTTGKTSDNGVQVNLYTAISGGQTARFTLLTTVSYMIYDDTQNQGNYGMQFIPTWYAATIRDLRVLIVLPTGVTTQNVKTSVNWDNNLTENGQLVIFWRRQNLTLNQRYTFGASFPKQYLPDYQAPSPSQPTPYDPQPSSWIPPSDSPSFYAPWSGGVAIFIFVFILLAVVGAVVHVAKRSTYLAPSLSMETLGIRRGLTAVEASYLLGVKPPRIVTEMIYSLLQKRIIWVESAKPSLKLKILQPLASKAEATQAQQESSPRYYEIDFVKAIRPDGTLDEEKLAQTYMFLRTTVEEKMRGYCRRDTIDYYTKIVDKAWQQVEQAGTPELASKAYDEQLLWLFLDPNYKARTDVAFRNRAFEPNPLWLWYWYGYQHYSPNPVYKPNIATLPQTTATTSSVAGTPTPQPTVVTQAAKPPTIPGSDFANNVVSSVENTANNFVANMAKFANAIIPLPAPSAKTSSEPVHHAASCACACVSCACVCACVSCACACAGGGVG